MESLSLDFNNSAFGESSQPNAIYRLKPNETPADKTIVEILATKIEQIKAMKSLEKLTELLIYKKQIILQGPPGTGKTYTAKGMAYNMIMNRPLSNVSEERLKQLEQLSATGQYSLIQFHPAYLYEDFVRGITVESEGGSVKYETKNKLLATFAKEALINYENSKKNEEQLSKDVWFAEQFDNFVSSISDQIANSHPVKLSKTRQITDVESNRFVYGAHDFLNFEQIKNLYNHDIRTVEEARTSNILQDHVKWRMTYYIPIVHILADYLAKHPFVNVNAGKTELKKYILVIDEINRANLPAVLGELIYALEYRGEEVNGLYGIDGDHSMILPPNLYIIGTMNTADRSVSHIDYAIRRRFGFANILPNKTAVNGIAEPLFKKVSNLFIKNYDSLDWEDPKLQRSDLLSADFQPGDVWLGHSYFMTRETEEPKAVLELQKKLHFEIIPILYEYVKDGVLLPNALEEIDQLMEAK